MLLFCFLLAVVTWLLLMLLPGPRPESRSPGAKVIFQIVMTIVFITLLLSVWSGHPIPTLP